MATIHVWADDPVNLSATLQGDKFKDVKKVEFVFKDGATEVGRAEAAYASGAATGKWEKAKGPDKPAAVRKLSYHVEIDGTPLANLPDEIHVWARELTVLAKGTDDKPYAGALAHISQTHVDIPSQYRTVDRKTGTDGTITWRLGVPGPVSVTWEPPWFVVGGAWTKNTGIDWECKIEKIAPVALKWPEPGRNKQWVNLDPDVSKPENGPIVKVVVVAGKDGAIEKGKKIYCKAVYGGDNSLRTPMTGGKKANETLELNADPDDQGGAKFDVPVGQAGGDTVLIKVGSTPDCIDGSTAIETWRRLSYELMAPECVKPRLEQNKDSKWDLKKDALQWLSTRTEPLFIEYKLRASHIFPDSEIAKYKHTAEFLQIAGGSGDYFVCSKNLVFNNADPVPFGATDKRTTFVRCADETAGEVAPALATQTVQAATTAFKVPGAIFNISMKDGSPSISGVKWSAVLGPTAPPDHPGRVSAGGAAKANVALAASAIKLVNFKNYQVVLDGDAAALVGPASATKCPIKVTWTWELASRVNGSALGSKQLMHVSRPPRAIACTFAHELGHSMGMTILTSGARARPQPEGMPAPAMVPGGFYYEGKSHNGSHCAFGLTDEQRALDSYKGLTGSCIIYGSGGDEPNPKRDRFCPTCVKYIRARNITDLEANWATKTGQQADLADTDDDLAEESTT